MKQLCDRCGKYHDPRFGCTVSFYYHIPGFEDEEWRLIRARSYLEAAEKAAEMADDYGHRDIIGDGGLDEIRIRNRAGEERCFSIRAELHASYHATEVAV